MRVYVLCILVVATGCQESPIQAVKAAAVKVVDDPTELTREKAKKLIESADKYPEKVTRTVVVGRRRLRVGQSIAALTQRDEDVRKLYEKGLVQIADEGVQSGVGFGEYQVINVMIQREYEEYLLRHSNNYLDVTATDAVLHVCDAYVVEVTGIRFENERNATAVLKIGVRNPTPFGFLSKTCSDSTFEAVREAELELWDDGWRATRVQGL